MTSLTTQPQLMATAAADVAEIRSAIGAANSAAAGPTTSVAAAAADEVSAATAALFGAYGQEYQAIIKQATAFHEAFAAALASAGSAYSVAEAANASAISGAATAIAKAVTSTADPQIALIMSGSGFPIPSQIPGYIAAVFNRYVGPNFPGSTFSDAQELVTPEGLYPLTGVKSLTLDQSVAQGVTILNNTLVGTGTGQHGLLVPPFGTNNVAVLGYSQSAVIASLEMNNLAALPASLQPPSNELSFVLLGDPMNPNGGLLARFPGFPAGQPLQAPSLGLTFYGATPQSTIYPTTIYTLQYDGYADFPRYPINFLSDLNAFLGTQTVHGTYPFIDPNNLPPGDQLIKLPGSVGMPGSSGQATATTYYMITQPGLPLVEPLRAIPIIGNPLADLLQPDLTTIVNLGYGDPNFGYSTAPANVQTPFGIFPHYSQALIAQDLVTGAQQGAAAFVSDIQTEASGLSLSSLSHSLTSLAGTGGAGIPLPALTSALSAASLSPDSIIESIQGAVTNIADGISGTAANLYAVLLPTADFANAVVTLLPAYDVNLFLSGIQQAIGGNVLGGLQYALVAPLAADTALLTMTGGLELEVLLGAL